MLQFGVWALDGVWWSMVGMVGKNVDATCEIVARLGGSDEMTDKNADEKKSRVINSLESDRPRISTVSTQ